MSTQTRGQKAFEQYQQGEEVKENKEYIGKVADSIQAVHIVFGLMIRRKYDRRLLNCQLTLEHDGATPGPVLRDLGTFPRKQAEEMYDIYFQALADALNKRIVIVKMHSKQKEAADAVVPIAQ